MNMRELMDLLQEDLLQDTQPSEGIRPAGDEQGLSEATHPSALDAVSTNTGTLNDINPDFADRSAEMRKHHHSVEDDDVFDTMHSYTELSGRLSRGLIAGKGGLDRHDMRRVKTVDQFLSRAQPLPAPLTVYSALGFIPEGDVLTSPAFLSASLDPRRAAAHANDRRNAKRASVDVIARFVLPEGYTGGRYLGVYGKYKGEMEYLIRRGERFRIVAREEHALEGPGGAFTRTVLTVVPA